MIQVHEEPKGMGRHEHCAQCGSPTRYWTMDAHTPLCKSCAALQNHPVDMEKEITEGNKLIESGNYDPTIHSLKHGCDAFGNPVVAPDGFRLLTKDEKIEDTDWHFDIYTGWTERHDGYMTGSYFHCDGRWRAWARKTKGTTH